MTAFAADKETIKVALAEAGEVALWTDTNRSGRVAFVRQVQGGFRIEHSLLGHVGSFASLEATLARAETVLLMDSDP